MPLLPREEVEAGIWAMFSVIAARNMATLLTIVERSSAIIANSKGILSRCPTRPQNQKIQAFPAVVSESSSVTVATSSLTPEMVQQMIITALSALGLQGSSVGESNREGA